MSIHHPLHWLYPGIVEPGVALCYLCGDACNLHASVANALADTFNSHYLAHAPHSTGVCSACWWYFNDKDHPEFRKMSLVVSPTTWKNWSRELMKNDIEQWLQNGLDADSYLVVSLSKKKHILLQAPLNAQGSRELAIQIEEQVAHVSLGTWQTIRIPFMGLLALGHGKGEILNGNLYASNLMKHGQIAEAMSYSGELGHWRNSPLIELFSYVTIVDKKEKLIDESEKSGGSDRSSRVPAGAGDSPGSSKPTQSRVERHRPRVPVKVQSDDLDTDGGESSRSEPYYEQLSLFSL